MSDTLIVTELATSVVEALADPSTMVLTINQAGEVVVITDAAQLEILEVESPNALVIEPDTLRSVEVLTAGSQGPAGRDGAAGDLLQMPAAGPISGHRIMAPDGTGRARYASSDNVADAGVILGLSVNAAVDGDNVSIQQAGSLTEPSWAWVPQAPVYCGVNGVLTQVPPTSGFILVVGIATTATTIVIGVKLPIIIN